ncbi:5'-AMP-activated protein kinase subunit beta-2-like [Halichondria panicea]|uniref:5'-AMP-activated protein kinase subunit beta-2-like n=1 Tax=Halichondria panicea TaxID=6063 RepID=UPI00312B7F64
MGQYQARPSKSETDLEAREGEFDIRISDRTTGDADVDEQPIKDDPVFGSPIDTGSYLATLGSSSSTTPEVSPQKYTEPQSIARTERITLKPKERMIPFVFRWDNGGEEVYLCGSFNNWETKIPLNHSQGDLTAIVELPLGHYEYKFVADGQWVHDPNEISVDNGLGSRNNVVTVDQKHFDAYYETWDLLEKGESSPPGSYSQSMPSRSVASGLPPLLPPLLQQTILNQEQPIGEDSIILSEPNHVILNHLYALSIKDNVLVLAATHRYKEKFVTTLTYKPVLA